MTNEELISVLRQKVWIAALHRKVAEMEADDLKLTEERNARCVGQAKSIQIMDRLEG